MEEICTALSEKLAEADRGYTVFYEDELLEALPDDLRNRDTLEAALKKLASDGCVDVKYARGNAFCIAYLKKFTPAPKPEECEAQETAQPEEPAISLPKRIYAAIALCAFSGGALGGILCAVIGAAI